MIAKLIKFLIKFKWNPISIGGYLNRWRGGGEQLLPDTTRLIKIPVIGLYYALPFLLVTQDLTILFYIWICTSWVSHLRGWGDYFDIGRSNKNYGNSENLWIDYILYKIYGPKWIPKEDLLAITRFDRIPSPTEKVRNYIWRYKRDLLGMSLRGLYYSLPLSFILIWHINPLYIFLAPLGLLLGPVYGLGWKNKINIESWDHGIAISEFIWGSLWTLILWSFAIIGAVLK